MQDVSKKKASGSNGISDEMPPRSTSKNHATRSKAKQLKASFSLVQLNSDTFKSNGKGNHGQETVHEGTPKSCGEHEYGSYCLWSTEHREVMKDDVVKRLKDQLFIARAHYPSIAKIKQHERFTRELKQSIQEHERMLSDTITDADLPPMLVPSWIQKKSYMTFFLYL
jgi:alpha-1,4-galacturonosyltransferase